MTVHTDPWAQCAAVSTQFVEIRLPPQELRPSIRRAAINGNSQGCGCQPPIIFGAWTSGAPSEIHMKPLVLIYLTTTFVYKPTHKILHNSQEAWDNHNRLQGLFWNPYWIKNKQVHTQNFSLADGGTGPEAIHNLCLILIIKLYNSCHQYNCNIT